MDLTSRKHFKKWSRRSPRWSNCRYTWRLTSTSNATRATRSEQGFLQGIHRNSGWLGWHLRVNTNFPCVENTPHTSMQQRMDWPDRRHTNSIFTCGSSNSGPLHVPAIVWRLLKAIYGPRSSPKVWQKHLAEVFQQIGLHRSTAEPNIYMTTSNLQLLRLGLRLRPTLSWRGTDRQHAFQGDPTAVFLRPTRTLSTRNTVTVAFPGRNFTNRGDHYEISLSDDYITTLLTETNLQDCKPAPAPGTPALNTATANHDQPLSTEEHAQYRRAVGKLQRMTCTSAFSSTLKQEQSTTSRRFQQKQFLTSALTWTAIVQDVPKQRDPQQDFLSHCVEQQPAMEAEHRQQLHSLVRRLSCMPSTLAQQKHTTRSASRSTQTHPSGKSMATRIGYSI